MGKTIRRKGVPNTSGRFTRSEHMSGKAGHADALFHSDKLKGRREHTRKPEVNLMDEENWDV